VLGRCGTRGLVRRRKRCGGLEGTSDLADVERIDEDARFERDELGRSADARCDDRLTARKRFEERLAERLDERRPAHHVSSAQPARHVLVRHAADNANAVAALQRTA
jgi:hypothetical protein